MPTARDVIGVWKLLACKGVNLDTGETVDVYGQNPNGYLCYTAGGRMFAILTRERRARLAGGGFDAKEASLQDKAEAYDTLDAYGGTYTLTADGVIHHVDIASNERRVGGDQTRHARIDGKILTIETPEMAFPHAPRAKSRLIWEKIE